MKIGTVPAVRIEKHQVPHPGHEFASPKSSGVVLRNTPVHQYDHLVAGPERVVKLIQFNAPVDKWETEFREVNGLDQIT